MFTAGVANKAMASAGSVFSAAPSKASKVTKSVSQKEKPPIEKVLQKAEKGWVNLTATKMNTHNFHLRKLQQDSSKALKVRIISSIFCSFILNVFMRFML